MWKAILKWFNAIKFNRTERVDILPVDFSQTIKAVEMDQAALFCLENEVKTAFKKIRDDLK